MNRLISVIALLPAILLVPHARAQTAPVLKPAAVVASGVVTIGDLISNAGKFADAAVFRAPDLGQTGTVAAQDILDAAAGRGLTGVNAASIAHVSVTRASRALSADEIESRVAPAIAADAGLEPEAVDVAVETPTGDIHLPVEADGEVQIRNAVWNRDGGTFDAILVVRRIDGQDEVRAIRGKAVETVEIVTAAREIPRGTILSAGDLTTVRQPKADIARGEISDLSNAVGMEARRMLREGHTVRASDLTEAKLVRGSSTVMVVLRSGGLTLTATAEALRDGKRGEIIQVMNTQSKRVLDVVVTGLNEVTVNPPRTLLSAAK